MEKRWQASVAGTVVLAVVIAMVGGLVALGVVGPRPGAGGRAPTAVQIRATSPRTPADATPTSAPLTTSPTTTAPVSTTATTAPATHAGSGASNRPSPSAVSIATTPSNPPVTSRPAATTTTVAAAGNGTGVWTTTSQGFTITLQVEPVDPIVGQEVQFIVTASSTTQWCCLIGATIATTSEPGAMPANPCPQAVPSTATQTYTHTFDTPNRWLVDVTVSGGKLCIGPPVLVNAHLQAAVAIGPAPATAPTGAPATAG